VPRNRRIIPGADRGGAFNDIAPDPSYVGGVAEAPFVRLPNPAVMFANRAARLRELAPGHTMAAYLLFLAGIVDAQAAAVTAVPPPAPIPADQVALRAGHAMPPIAEDQVRGNASLLRTLDHILGTLDLTSAPQAAQEAADRVRAMADDERLSLAADLFGGSIPFDRMAEALFVAAALQVHLARLATQLDAKAVAPTEAGVCPACGAPPVSSLVVGWTQASKARYCACSLCGTLWNHVRIRCTACGSTEGIAYYTIEDGPKTVGVETCPKCRSYIKHMQQHEDGRIDPVADDIASYALDLLIAEDDFRRSSVNPLFVAG
jgi:FdhE protein